MSERDRPPTAGAPPGDLDWAARVQRLEAEVAGMRRAMASRGVIEQAKGVLAERMRITPDDAFGQLSSMSQRNNVRLADVAGSVLAAMDGVATDFATGSTDGGNDDGNAEPTDPPQHLRGGLPVGVAAPLRFAPAYQRVAAAASASPDLSALAEALRASGIEADLVCFHSTGGADDARRVAAAFGTSAEASLGAAADALASAAARARTALWRDGTRPSPTADRDGTAEARAAAYPWRDSEHVDRVVTFCWMSPAPFTDDERAYLGALAQLAHRTAGPLWADQAHPIAPLLDAVFAPGLLLMPVRDTDGEVVDFLIEYASLDVPAMGDLSRAEQIGRRLLDTYPHLATSGVFDAYRQVLATGEPYERATIAETVVVDGSPTVVEVSRRAIRYAGGVLASWQREDGQVRRKRQMRRMEALGGFGWADWDLVGRQTYWSPGLYRIFNRDALRGPVALASLPESVRSADRAAVAAMVDTVAGGRAAAAEFRLVRDNGERHIRVIAEPLAAADGRVVGAVAVAQDLTESRLADERMLRVQAQLAEQRLNLAAQRELTRELRRVLYPGFACEAQTPVVRVVGRHVAPDEDQHLRGDFCDTTLLEDGHILFAIGDSFGSGVRAGEVLARLLYPARALGNAGVPPGAILRILNGDLHRDVSPPLASIVVGRFCPVESAVTWAQGGHLPPVRVRARGADMIDRPAGASLGLLPGVDYAQSRVPVSADDTLVWMTDGMVYERSRPDVDPWPGLRRRLVAARRAGGMEEMFTLCTAADGDEACMLVLHVSGAAPSGRSTCRSPGCASAGPSDGMSDGSGAGQLVVSSAAANAPAGESYTEMT